MKPLLIHPEALGELQEAPLYYYDDGNIKSGDELVAELNLALEQVSERPGSWKRILEDIHSYGPTKKFKWRVVYVDQPQSVFVIAAYYSGVEDPLYWIERLAS